MTEHTDCHWGNCQDFCPEKERRERQRQRRVHVLEQSPGTKSTSGKGPPSLIMIKEYSRPAAGKDATRKSDLRPPPVLLRVVHYMMTETDVPWHQVYHFIFDRLRAVRQDLVIQQASCPESVKILEHAVSFHLYAGYRLCEEDLSNFVPKFNGDHCQECLKRLLVEYREHGLKSDNRAYFEALYILYNLGSFEVLHNALKLPPDIRNHPSVKLSLAISRCYLQGNFVRLGRLSRKCDFIQSCALHRSLPEIRCEALATLNAGFCSKNLRLPTDLLAKWLMFDAVEDAVQFCQQSGLDASHAGVLFRRGNLQLNPASWPDKKSDQLVDCKYGSLTISELILGPSYEALDNLPHR